MSRVARPFYARDGGNNVTPGMIYVGLSKNREDVRRANRQEAWRKQLCKMAKVCGTVLGLGLWFIVFYIMAAMVMAVN